MAKRRTQKRVVKAGPNAPRLEPRPAGPYLLPATLKSEPPRKLEISVIDNPAKDATLGDIGLATQIAGGNRALPPTILIQPFDQRGIVGVDPISIRVFRWDEKLGVLRPVWNSGVNLSSGYVWAKIQRPGTYVPIGLPRDKVLQSVIQVMALQRQYADPESAEERRALTDASFELFFKAPEADLELLRGLLANLEVQTNVRTVPYYDLVMGNGGHIMGFMLPG